VSKLNKTKILCTKHLTLTCFFRLARYFGHSGY
jgi:hypothetical protein